MTLDHGFSADRREGIGAPPSGGEDGVLTVPGGG